MKEFLNKDFLLTTDAAQRLYHEAAAKEPLFDYHCHLDPEEIARDRRFSNLAEIWLGGDHYKWRTMRALGVDEERITGKAEPWDKFLAWAKTAPYLIGNPLYHWTHLELQRYFDIHEPLSPASAPAIWKAANERLKNDPAFSVFGIFKKFNVYAVGTTDDPADSLEHHKAVAGKTPTKVLPSFRPDKAINIDKDGFVEYIWRLSEAGGVTIHSLVDLLNVLTARIDLFHALGCRAADHGLESVPFELDTDGGAGLTWERETDETFRKAMGREPVTPREAESFKTFMITRLASEYNRRDWAMQLHVAALRNNNDLMFRNLGPDTGYDAVHDLPVAAKLARLLDRMESDAALPRVILYSLNFKDLYPMATIMGCFQGAIPRYPCVPGKMQLGSAWWFLDHKDGMEDQMRLLANVGLLSRFIGMLTDSRSFLSYPRHEYFRRILCNMVGTWAENGEIPADMDLLSGMVRDIAFGNARRYFEG